MLQHFLSKTELAYVQRTKEFTKAQQRCIRYRLNKKLRLLGVNGESMSEFRDAASELRDGADNLLPLGRWSSLVRIPPPDVIVDTERDKNMVGRARVGLAIPAMSRRYHNQARPPALYTH